jgi:hypothetical protein
LFFAIGASAKVPTVSEAAVFNAENVSAKGNLQPTEITKIRGLIFDGDYTRSFEMAEDCKDFALTEKEVFDFFIRAKHISLRKLKRANVGESRCELAGDTILKDGREVRWTINKAGYSVLQPHGSHDVLAVFYCDACQDKFYSKKGNKLNDLRPVIKSIEITLNPVDIAQLNPALREYESNPERCAHFVLTEKNVLGYFKNARASSPTEYMSELDAAPCFVQGNVKLNDGREGTWSIDGFGRGYMGFLEGTAPNVKDNVYYYYCKTPNNPAACKKQKE